MPSVPDMTNPTACREAFEKWCDEVGMDATRSKGQSGYAHIETQNHWNTYQDAWNTRAPEGEAVAWLWSSPHMVDLGEPHNVTTDKALIDRVMDQGWVVVPLYAHPRATSAEVERDAAIEAIDAEPEFPGEMPDEMWLAIHSDRDACTEAMRIAVRQTKSGIRARLIAALARRGEVGNG